MFEYVDVEGDKITVDSDADYVFVSIEGIDDESGSVAIPWDIAMKLSDSIGAHALKVSGNL